MTCPTLLRRIALVTAALLLGACAARLNGLVMAPNCAPTGDHGALTATFYGVSTISISDGATKLMADGFLSRPSLAQLVFTEIRPDHSRIRQAIGDAPRFDAVIVGHSHFDHALDSATVAAMSCARIVGSRSTANIALGEGFPRERIDVFPDVAPPQFGHFTLRAIPTRHGVPLLAEGEIHAPLAPPSHAVQYRHGGSSAFLIEHGVAGEATPYRVLIISSANFPEVGFGDVEADVVFLGVGIAGRREEFLRAYWEQAVRRTRARSVVAVHWDDFTAPLSEGLRPIPWPVDDFASTKRVLCALARGDNVELIFPAALQVITLQDGLQEEMDEAVHAC